MKLAQHTLWKSADKLDPFTVSFFRILISKSGHFVTETSTDTTRTFAICRESAPAAFTPDSDATREREDSAGQAYESEHHELSPLERQREAWALGNPEE